MWRACVGPTPVRVHATQLGVVKQVLELQIGTSWFDYAWLGMPSENIPKLLQNLRPRDVQIAQRMGPHTDESSHDVP